MIDVSDVKQNGPRVGGVAALAHLPEAGGAGFRVAVARDVVTVEATSSVLTDAEKELPSS